MRESDIDWEIYHIIVAAGNGCPRSRILDETFYEEDAVDDSLRRLVSLLVIDECEQVYHAVSVQEYMLKCQLKECHSPITIENGIIKVKRPDE